MAKWINPTKAISKQTTLKVKYEDVGYDSYNGVNLYACICPSCGLEIIRFDDNDISDDYPDSIDGDIEAMFKSSLVHHCYEGLNEYCNRCEQKLDWGNYG